MTNPHSALRALLVISCTAAALSCPAGSRAESNAPPASAFELAMADYEHQRYAAAYQALWLLADQGHAEAARIALLMATHGPRLYGMRFAIGPVQRERWLVAALPHAGDVATASAR